MKTTRSGCECFLFIVVTVPSLVMFIGGAISYNAERIKEKTYLIGQCRIIAISTKTLTCTRTTGFGKHRKFSSIYLNLSDIVN